MYFEFSFKNLSVIISQIIFASNLSSGASIYVILFQGLLSVQSSFFIQLVLFLITAFAHSIIVFVDL
jgi:hypothetical protein